MRGNMNGKWVNVVITTNIQDGSRGKVNILGDHSSERGKMV